MSIAILSNEELQGIVRSHCGNSDSIDERDLREWREARAELTRRGIFNYEAAQVEPARQGT